MGRRGDGFWLMEKAIVVVVVGGGGDGLFVIVCGVVDGYCTLHGLIGKVVYVEKKEDGWLGGGCVCVWWVVD